MVVIDTTETCLLAGAEQRRDSWQEENKSRVKMTDPGIHVLCDTHAVKTSHAAQTHSHTVGSLGKKDNHKMKQPA